MTSLLDDLTNRAEAPKRPKRCTFGHIYDSLDSIEQDALDKCIVGIEVDKDLPQPQRVFTISWLVETLGKHGYSVGKTVVSDHIGKRCSCGK